jgi:hypothetical protein
VDQFESVLKGRGFSRAVNGSNQIAALAAVGCVFQADPLGRGASLRLAKRFPVPAGKIEIWRSGLPKVAGKKFIRHEEAIDSVGQLC